MKRFNSIESIDFFISIPLSFIKRIWWAASFFLIWQKFVFLEQKILNYQIFHLVWCNLKICTRYDAWLIIFQKTIYCLQKFRSLFFSFHLNCRSLFFPQIDTYLLVFLPSEIQISLKSHISSSLKEVFL